MGIVFILYYIACVLYAGMGASLVWIWLVGGLALVVLGGTLLVCRKHGIVLQIIAVRVALLLPQRGGRQNQERQQRQQAQCGGDVSFYRPHRAHLTPSGRSWPWFP